jgi:2-methylcitrate dehydratase PrpD
MTALDELAAWIVSCRAGSESVRELVELHLVDTVGAWVASTGTGEGLALLRLRAALGSSEQADKERIGWDLATHCALARLSEIDDIHLPSMITPGGVVVPGAVTLAQVRPSVTADDVMAAILAGVEAMTRLGRAIDGPAILYRGIWPTYFAAPVGIAAVAARLFKLDEQQTANALALALVLAAPGVGHHNATTTARWFALGHAARNGLAAAMAAQQGFTSDRQLMEGRFFRDVYGVTHDIGALTDGLGDGAALSEISFKPWCAARQTMAATQALKEIIESGVPPEAISAITVSVLPPHLKMIDHGVVAGDRASHLTSLQYCMAIAAFAPERAFDLQQTPPEVPAAVRSFMAKITLEADQDLLADYPRSWPARVRVVAGAAQHERKVAHVPGDPARPFDCGRVDEKFLRFTQPALGTQRAERMLARCHAATAAGEFAPLLGEVERVCDDALARRARC